jgi:hypothetical protein
VRRRSFFIDNRSGQDLVNFHDDPAYHVPFTTDAGSVGLNLQRVSRLDFGMPALVLILAHDDPQQGPMADEFMAAGACLSHRDWRVARDLLNHKDSAETGCGQRLPTTQRTPIRRSQSVRRFRPAVIFVLGLIIEPGLDRLRFRLWRGVPDPRREL